MSCGEGKELRGRGSGLPMVMGGTQSGDARLWLCQMLNSNEREGRAQRRAQQTRLMTVRRRGDWCRPNALIIINWGRWEKSGARPGKNKTECARGAPPCVGCCCRRGEESADTNDCAGWDSGGVQAAASKTRGAQGHREQSLNGSASSWEVRVTGEGSMGRGGSMRVPGRGR